ncbi:MAG: GIY-YIG nuclease family protein [Tenericutes bacterium]|nr:GIY-YIG nuclease family protein [Mycoplasmatota bacterium]
MANIDDLIKNFGIIDGDFHSLDAFDFCGVYIIYDPNEKNDVVYVGSAYVRTISQRLSQYKKTYDTGNSLMHAICKKDFNVSKVSDISNEQKQDAVEKIHKLKIKAIKHKDLEYQIIQESNPKYNTAGVQIDTTE